VDETFTTNEYPMSMIQPRVLSLLAIPNIAFPVEGKESGAETAKGLVDKQKLAKALKVCRKKSKSKRAGCEKRARRKFGAVRKRTRA
jgi:hypothetical protein